MGGREQGGAPQRASNSPAGCCLARGRVPHPQQTAAPPYPDEADYGCLFTPATGASTGSPVRTKEATNDPCGSLCNLALATGKDKRVDYML